MNTKDIHRPLLRSRGPGAQKKSMVGLLLGEGEGWDSNHVRIFCIMTARDMSMLVGLKKLVRISSVCTSGNRDVALETARLFRRAGLRVYFQKTRIGGELFMNVVGLKGRGTTSPLLLCSHLDTVPPGDLKKWTQTRGNPWNPVQKKNKLFGLGSADDKGPMAAMIHAASLFKEDDLRRPLALLGSFGEESGMGGARLFVKSWKNPKPCLAVVGEPTALGITYRHKGIGVMELFLKSRNKSSPHLRKRVHPNSFTFRGRQAHSSRPWLGDNALDKAMVFLKSYCKKNPNAQVHSLEGGYAANLIPDQATLVASSDLTSGGLDAPALLACIEARSTLLKFFSKKKDRTFYPPQITSNFGIARTECGGLRLIFDFRLLPGQEAYKIYSVFQKELLSALKKFPKVEWKIRIERDNPALPAHSRDPWVRFGSALLKKNKLPHTLTVKPACTEAGIYHAWGVPAFIFGPGESQGNIHEPNESMHIPDLKKAVKFYASAIQKICVENVLNS